MPTVGEGRCGSLDDVLFRSSSSCASSNKIPRKQSWQSSDGSTCVPSDCGSDIGDTESLGVSTPDAALSSPWQAPLLSPRGSYTSLVELVLEQQEQRVLDAFVEANEAHIQYLLIRRQRLEAEGKGVRSLCK